MRTVRAAGGSGGVRRYGLTLVVAVATATVMAAFPAGAHITKRPAHNWNKHYKKLARKTFFTKQQSNNRFLRTGQGLRLEPDPDGPNVIGGFSDNEVNEGATGAVIGGGGGVGQDPNRVTDGHGTVGGGTGNVAGNDDADPGDHSHATVGGGFSNTASGLSATVGGGDTNIASGDRSIVGGGVVNEAGGPRATVGGGVANAAGGDAATVGGGNSNTADGLHATVGGGINHSASNTQATVAGGGTNTASGIGSTVGGGTSNMATGHEATVGGGDSNEASGLSATVAGGANNEATQASSIVGGGLGNDASGPLATVGGGHQNSASTTYATVPGGHMGHASLYGQLAHASGRFSAVGDAQASEYVLRRATSDANPTELFLDGDSVQLTLTAGRRFSFEALVVGGTSAGETAGYRMIGLIENIAGATAFVGTPTVEALGEDDAAWDAAALADDPNDALVIQVTGDDTDPTRWVATVKTVELAFP